MQSSNPSPRRNNTMRTREHTRTLAADIAILLLGIFGFLVIFHTHRLYVGTKVVTGLASTFLVIAGCVTLYFDWVVDLQGRTRALLKGSGMSLGGVLCALLSLVALWKSNHPGSQGAGLATTAVPAILFLLGVGFMVMGTHKVIAIVNDPYTVKGPDGQWHRTGRMD